jgi:hypothetical protein
MRHSVWERMCRNPIVGTCRRPPTPSTPCERIAACYPPQGFKLCRGVCAAYFGPGLASARLKVATGLDPSSCAAKCGFRVKCVVGCVESPMQTNGTSITVHMQSWTGFREAPRHNQSLCLCRSQESLATPQVHVLYTEGTWGAIMLRGYEAQMQNVPIARHRLLLIMIYKDWRAIYTFIESSY